MFEKKLIIFLLLISLPFLIHAQNDTIKYDVELSGVTSTGTYSPFWLQSKSYGTIPDSPNNADLFLGISKNYGKSSRLFNVGFKSNLLL